LGYKRVGDSLHIVVPVTIVQVGNQSSCGFGQVIGILGNGAMIVYTLDEYHVVSVGREAESLNVELGIGELNACRSIGIHLPELSVAEKSDLLSAFDPCGIALAFGIGGERRGFHDGLPGLGRLYEEHGVALVFLHTVIAHLIYYLLAIG